MRPSSDVFSGQRVARHFPTMRNLREIRYLYARIKPEIEVEIEFEINQSEERELI